MIIFVFGSNTAGHHGAGAAADAQRWWGACPGVGEGLSGESDAVPTKEQYTELGHKRLRPRKLEDIEASISELLRYMEDHPNVDFQVTALGCGYAGFTPAQIAPMFVGAPTNAHLPLGWRSDSLHGVNSAK